MEAKPWITPLLGGLLCLGGCDDAGKPSRISVSTATTRPSATQTSATTAPTTGPTTALSASVMLVNGQTFEFPRARLRSASRAQTLMLFTDDPKQAISDNYHLNSYYFDLKIDGGAIDQLKAGTAIHFKASSMTERVDTMHGIFLDGGRSHLQPFDVYVALQETGDVVTARVWGQFLLFNTRDTTAPPQMVMVNGILSAPLEK